MGICNKGAGVISPLILGAIILKDASEIESKINITTDQLQRTALLQELSDRVIMPYIIPGLCFILLRVHHSVFLHFRISNQRLKTENGQASKTSILQFPHLLLGSLCIFLYVGVEKSWQAMLSAFMGKAIGISLDDAKNFTSYTLRSMVCRITFLEFSPFQNLIKQEKALAISAVVGILFSVLAYLSSGYMSHIIYSAPGIR